MTNFKLQYISDVHLEFNCNIPFCKIIKPNAPYLALCGDIGYPHKQTFKDFISYCSNNWEQVFYITGNHDYYNKLYTNWKYKEPYSMEEIELYIDKLFKEYSNVHFLQKQSFEISNYILLGCTLWSHIDIKNYSEAKSSLNDFNYICKDDHQYTINDYVELHKDHSLWLLNELKKYENTNKKIIVLTHHLPSEILIDIKYISNPINFLFYTELTEHLNSKMLIAWICGHSHSTKRIMYKPGVELMLNCKGYPSEKLNNFNLSCVYEEKVNNLDINEEIDLL